MPPLEKRFISLVCSIHEIQSSRRDFFINGLYPFLGQRSRIFDLSIATAVDASTRTKIMSCLSV